MTLREKVAQGIALEDGRIWDRMHFAKKERYRSRADAATRLVLEEAAKVAEEVVEQYDRAKVGGGYRGTAVMIARRIRSLGDSR